MESKSLPYTPGTAEQFYINNNGLIPIDVGDTCSVVGGQPFIDQKMHAIRTAWPRLNGNILSVLPFDLPFFKRENIAVEQVKNEIKPLTFTSPTAAERADELQLKISDGQIYRNDGIRYRGITNEDLPELKRVYEACFRYPIAPDIILALFTQTGGHLGGIFEREKMIGFTTVLVAILRNAPSKKALFIDSVGTIPNKRNLHVGSFALAAVELAAQEAGLSHIALTHAENLSPFYEKNGFEKKDYLLDIYGPGASRIYAVRSFENHL